MCLVPRAQIIIMGSEVSNDSLCACVSVGPHVNLVAMSDRIHGVCVSVCVDLSRFC
jgi:hypothetical protein